MSLTGNSDSRRILEELSDAAARFQEQCRDHEEYVRRMVGVLRGAGASWEEIGQAFGTSKQAAWERFR